jgi:hypothetical protein
MHHDRPVSGKSRIDLQHGESVLKGIVKRSDAILGKSLSAASTMRGDEGKRFAAVSKQFPDSARAPRVDPVQVSTGRGSPHHFLARPKSGREKQSDQKNKRHFHSCFRS